MEYVSLTPSLSVSRLCFGSLTVGPLQANLPVERGAEVIAYARNKKNAESAESAPDNTDSGDEEMNEI